MSSILRSGTRLGPYVIARLLGKGGMGEVYEGYEPILNRKVAIKVIANTAIEKPKALDLFISEGKALAQLNHPNVVTIYQLGFDQDIHFIAMEYIDGKSLESFVKDENPDVATRLNIFYKILLGVQALHRKGIAHRDLKPKNIMVLNAKSVKIVDFGIAEFVQNENDPRQSPNGVIGSAHYMAPEVARGGVATFQSDIWSLGIILYQLMTNKLPFAGRNNTEILAKIQNVPLSISALETILFPSEITALIMKMCERPLNARYKSVDEVIRDLAAKSPAAPNAKSWIPGAVGAAVAAIGITIAVFIWKADDKPAKSDEFASIVPTAPTAQPAPPPTFETKAPIAPEPAEPIPIALEPSVPIVTQTQDPGISTHTVLKPAKPRSTLPRVSLRPNPSRIVLNFDSGFNPRSPASVKNAMTNPPLLSWNQVPGAEKYQVQISTTPTFSSNHHSQETRDAQLVWTPTATGSFYWRVRALAAGRTSGEFSPSQTIKIEISPPIASKHEITVTLPDGRKPAEASRVDWAPSPLTKQYLVTGKATGSDKASLFKETVTDTQFRLPIREPGTYLIFITALDSKRAPASLPSKPVKVLINNAMNLASPSLRQPQNKTVVPSQGTMITPIVYSWRKVKLASKYEFQLSSESDFRQIRHEATVEDTRYLLTTPLPKGEFYWRVRSVSGNTSKSPWSPPNMFVMD